MELFFIIVTHDVEIDGAFPIEHNLDETIFCSLDSGQKALENVETHAPAYGAVFATLYKTEVSLEFWCKSLGSSIYDYADVLEEIGFENYFYVSSKTIWE